MVTQGTIVDADAYSGPYLMKKAEICVTPCVFPINGYQKYIVIDLSIVVPIITIVLAVCDHCDEQSPALCGLISGDTEVRSQKSEVNPYGERPPVVCGYCTLAEGVTIIQQVLFVL